MPDQNGIDPARLYADAQQAQLGERVTNLGRRQSDLESEMRSGFRAMEQSITAFTNETRNSIAALSTSLAERNKPQWQAIGVALTFAVIIGGMAYWPIRETTGDMKTDLKSFQDAVAERMVTRDEMDWRSARGQEDRLRMEGSVADIRASTVSRNEWTERNRARDQEVADLSRRVDEIRQEVGAVYGTRDVIQDMKKEIDVLRQRISLSRRTSP